MQQMTQVPASHQLEQLKQQLLQAYVEKDEAEARVKAADEKITAIRNILAGVGIGQQVEAERAASVAAKKAEESTPNE